MQREGFTEMDEVAGQMGDIGVVASEEAVPEEDLEVVEEDLEVVAHRGDGE